MAIIETQAIVLQTFKLADADKIAVCMTESAGVVRGVARGALRLKSKFGAGLEPFTHIRLTYFEKESRELVTIKEAEILKSYFGAARDADVVQTLGYLAELVKEFAPPHQANERLFKMLRACIDAAALHAEMLQPITVYAELWALKLTGLLAETKVCGGCGKRLGETGEGIYISAEGVLRCRTCRQSGWQSIGQGVHKLLNSMRALGPKAWAETFQAIQSDDRQNLSDIARRLVFRALEREPRAKKVSAALRTAAPAGGIE